MAKKKQALEAQNDVLKEENNAVEELVEKQNELAEKKEEDAKDVRVEAKLVAHRVTPNWTAWQCSKCGKTYWKKVDKCECGAEF